MPTDDIIEERKPGVPFFSSILINFFCASATQETNYQPKSNFSSYSLYQNPRVHRTDQTSHSPDSTILIIHHHCRFSYRGSPVFPSHVVHLSSSIGGSSYLHPFNAIPCSALLISLEFSFRITVTASPSTHIS
ncbi:hypothetical protein V6Z11_D11G378800 [Gossypium hirsutum]